jgi:hypothetical protein
MESIGKFMPLKSGKGVMVETKPGEASVVIRTGKSVKWWQFLVKNLDQLNEAVGEYSGIEQMALFLVATTHYDDEAIMRIVQQAWEDAPDDTATRESPLFTLLSNVLDGAIE